MRWGTARILRLKLLMTSGDAGLCVSFSSRRSHEQPAKDLFNRN